MRTAGARSSSASTGSGSGRSAYAVSARWSRCSTSARRRSAVRPRAVDDARPELALEERQHGVADPRPREPRVVVGGVGPPGDVLGAAGLLGLGAGQVEQGAAEHAEDAAHAGQRPGPASPGEAEEHRLGLVVEGVAEQHRVRAVAVGDLLQDGVAGLPGGGLEALALGLDPYPDRRGLVGAQRGHLPDDARGHLGRRLVQAVVDGHAHDRPGTGASLEHGSGQQREGVGTAGARDQDRCGAGVGWRAGGERAAYGDPGGGDGGVGTHDRRPRGPASPRRRDRRSRPWWAGGRGPARRR